VSTDSPILPPANRAGKRISIALAIAVHLVLAAFLFYGVRWQTKATDVVEVELVRAAPAVVTPPVAVTPAPTLEPPPPSKPEPAPPRKPDIVIKEKEKPKPPPKPEPKPEPKPRVDPFQEQLKREAEQLTQRRRPGKCRARSSRRNRPHKPARPGTKAIDRLPGPHPRQDPRQHRGAARSQGQSGGGFRRHPATRAAKSLLPYA
jgi:outer membrane biosynthesis protein TonB